MFDVDGVGANVFVFGGDSQTLFSGRTSDTTIASA
jgi:hypothetical protein